MVTQLRAGQLALLRKLRAHPGLQNIVNCLLVDRSGWAEDEKMGLEEYDGEARERREAYDMVIELLTGKKA